MVDYLFIEKVFRDEGYLEGTIASSNHDPMISICKSLFPGPVTKATVDYLVTHQCLYVILFMYKYCVYDDSWQEQPSQETEIAIVVRGAHAVLSNDSLPPRIFRAMGFRIRTLIWQVLKTTARIFPRLSNKTILANISICGDIEDQHRDPIFRPGKWGRPIQQFSMTCWLPRSHDPVNIALRGLGLDRAIEAVARIISEYPSHIPLVSIGSGKGLFEYYWEQYYHHKYNVHRAFACVDPSTGFGPGEIRKAPDYATVADVPHTYKGRCIMLLNYIPFGGTYASDSILTLNPQLVLIVYSNVNSEYPSEAHHSEYSKAPVLACFHPALYSVLMRWDRIDDQVLREYLPRIKQEVSAAEHLRIWTLIMTSYHDIPRIKSVLQKILNRLRFSKTGALRNLYNYLSVQQAQRKRDGKK